MALRRVGCAPRPGGQAVFPAHKRRSVEFVRPLGQTLNRASATIALPGCQLLTTPVPEGTHGKRGCPVSFKPRIIERRIVFQLSEPRREKVPVAVVRNLRFDLTQPSTLK